MEISGQQFVSPPTEIPVSQDANITLRKTLHNNGPSGPVDVDISTAASTPASCTATASPANPTSANLPVSTDVIIDEVWTIRCSNPSASQFGFNNSITISTPYVSDPNPTNNSAYSSLTVNVIP